MNLDKLRGSAKRLRSLLDTYAKQDTTAGGLRRSLLPLLDQSIAGAITAPVDTGQIPGSYLFQEKHLREFPGLEDAYAKFKLEISGGDARWGAVLASVRQMKASPP